MKWIELFLLKKDSVSFDILLLSKVLRTDSRLKGKTHRLISNRAPENQKVLSSHHVLIMNGVSLPLIDESKFWVKVWIKILSFRLVVSLLPPPKLFCITQSMNHVCVLLSTEGLVKDCASRRKHGLPLSLFSSKLTTFLVSYHLPSWVADAHKTVSPRKCFLIFGVSGFLQL